MNHKTPFRLVDTHCHLYLDGFQNDVTDVIDRMERGIFPDVRGKDVGIPAGQFLLDAAIMPGIDADSSRRVVEMAARHSILHPAVAIHPNYTSEAQVADWATIEQLASTPGVVAIGETGLDLYRKYSPLEVQLDYFRRHLDLAARLDLPLILHCRDADDVMLPQLRQAVETHERHGRHLRGSIHSFSADANLAREYLSLGFHVGFTGSVTYTNKKGASLWDAARAIPDDRLLIETDSPFLVPHPFRGKLERNEPLMVVFVAKRLAELRETSTEIIIEQTSRNAKELFGIGSISFD